MTNLTKKFEGKTILDDCSWNASITDDVGHIFSKITRVDFYARGRNEVQEDRFYFAFQGCKEFCRSDRCGIWSVNKAKFNQTGLQLLQEHIDKVRHPV